MFSQLICSVQLKLHGKVNYLIKKHVFRLVLVIIYVPPIIQDS